MLLDEPRRRRRLGARAAGPVRIRAAGRRRAARRWRSSTRRGRCARRRPAAGETTMDEPTNMIDDRSPRLHATDPGTARIGRLPRIERERMAGLPLLNPALQVQALGLRALAGALAGRRWSHPGSSTWCWCPAAVEGWRLGGRRRAPLRALSRPASLPFSAASKPRLRRVPGLLAGLADGAVPDAGGRAGHRARGAGGAARAGAAAGGRSCRGAAGVTREDTRAGCGPAAGAPGVPVREGLTSSQQRRGRSRGSSHASASTARRRRHASRAQAVDGP
jgi:hypothetical protein